MPDVDIKATRILSPGEEKQLDKAIADLKDMRDGKELLQGVGFETKDKAGIDKKITDLERVRRNYSIPELAPQERNQAMAQLKLLEDDLRKDMPTWTEYESVRPHHGARYVAMVRLLGKWEADPIRRQKVQRWKTLRRLVDPSDPQAGNVMYLFPQ